MNRIKINRNIVAGTRLTKPRQQEIAGQARNDGEVGIKK